MYFSDNKGWGTVYAYAWDAKDSALNGGWPGTVMTYVETNDFGEKIYKVELPATVAGLIFNGGDDSKKTKDIKTGIANNKGFYVADDQGETGTYDYNPQPGQPETPAEATYIVAGNNAAVFGEAWAAGKAENKMTLNARVPTGTLS